MNAFAHLEAALQCDLALTTGQVARFYGLHLHPQALEHEGFSLTTRTIAPTARSRESALREVSFVTLEPDARAGHALRHLVGVAELRHRLQARVGDWRVQEYGAIITPDAEWHRGSSRIAVEFDASRYALATVHEKAQYFRNAFDGQVWAVSSQTRRNSLTAVLGFSPALVKPF
ncbi:MAG: hypothetical protein HC933_09240 [Pleurocapsa sp. SU_196_0]|nr:hypothetical protein [Pleurocapsa sp. SU_196_0]